MTRTEVAAFVGRPTISAIATILSSGAGAKLAAVAQAAEKWRETMPKLPEGATPTGVLACDIALIAAVDDWRGK